MEMPEILRKAAEKSGFKRIKFIEKNIPTAPNRITVMSVFGDIRAMCILSSLLLHRIKEELKGSRYFIFCSWPGFEGLFPYVDEYWAVKDNGVLKEFCGKATGFKNDSELAVLLPRNLNYYFQDTMLYEDVTPYYDNGITQEFFDRFRNIKKFLPTLPSSVILGNEFNLEMAQRPGYKIFIHPTVQIRAWHNGKQHWVKTPKDFWIELVKTLVDSRYCPVVYRDHSSYDLSPDLTTECIHLRDKDILSLLSAMRASDCVLDVFNGSSRLAITARCPYLAIDERARFTAQKEYEIDDLCGRNVPKEYIFSFSTIIRSGNLESWKTNLFNNVVARLNNFLPDLDRNNLPPVSESYEMVTYDNVRKHKAKRLGARFVKLERI